ncbi:MAG: antitermination regulator [Glaciihabitans sp.]|jgi:hypothetical protein|nr:antitermination regulator [Glaciihabitans sp.]
MCPGDGGDEQIPWMDAASLSSLAHLSALFVAELPVTGASISVITHGRSQSTISASDLLAAKLDEIQFALGEGPHWDAQQSGLPVMVSDILVDGRAEWPTFNGAVASLGVRALFAFPLYLGAVTVGVADLYCSSPGPLGDRAVETATMLCRAVVAPALKHAIRLADEHDVGQTGLAVEMRRDVHQATGMILAQLGISATEAFVRLKAHAYSSGTTLQQAAEDVVGRRIDFRDLPE